MPQTPEDRWTTVNGLGFHYRDWGGSGRPVALLHGLASNCRIWDLVAPLLARDCRVVALDQRGHGESDKPDHGYDFATVAGDLAGFIEALGLRYPIIAGHSWGGDVALELAVSCPEIPAGLCFVDGGMIDASARHPTLQDALEQMAPPIFAGVTRDRFVQRIRAGQLGSWMTPQVEAAVLANFETLEDNTVRARLSRDNHLRIIEALWEHHPFQLYPQARCPVLVMPARRGSDDAAVQRSIRREESVARASALLPVSDTVWLEDSIHDVPLQRPELVAGVILERIQAGFFG